MELSEGCRCLRRGCVCRGRTRGRKESSGELYRSALSLLDFLTSRMISPMDSAQRFGRIARLLSVSAKQKILRAVPLFLQRAAVLHDSKDISKAAINALRPGFPSASAAELHALAFYLIAKVAVSQASVAPGMGSRRDLAGDIRTIKDTVKGKLDSLSEMGEMESLRLQMQMGRRSKFMSTLSKLLKTISDTDATLTSNIK